MDKNTPAIDEVLMKDLKKIIKEVKSPDFKGENLIDLISDFEEILTMLRAVETVWHYMEK